MTHKQTLIELLLMVALCWAAGASQAVAQPRALHPASRVDPTPPALPPAGLRNVLLIIVDDMGIDLSKQYLPVTGNTPATLPDTPAIRKLAKSGIIFHNAWANPVCSPTRAGVLTGRHAFRTTVTDAIPQGPDLPAAELTLPELIADADARYVSGLFGKWHLGGGVTGPNDQGFAEHRGSLTGSLDAYDSWDKYVNGVQVDGDLATAAIDPVTDYATQVTVADAVDWIQAQTSRWFAVVAFNAPHTPRHTPTATCDGVDPLGSGDINAMIKCVNDHIDSLLAQLANLGKLENTTVILLGDNGTESDSIQGPFAVPPYRSHKGAVYEGGIRVPLIIADGYHLQHGTVAPASSGRGYISNPGRREETMVHAVDIFATVAGIVGVASTVEDSVSILPHLGADARLLPLQYYARQFMYTERCIVRDQLYQAAIRNSDYKLIYRFDYDANVLLPQELYAVADLAEMNDLAGMNIPDEALLLGELNSMWALGGFTPGNDCP